MASRAWAPLAVGLLVFLGGFFPLLLVWWLGGYVDDQRGLFHFRSATWGDGLCLPLMAGALVLLNSRMSVPPSKVRRKRAGIVGAALGAGIQIFWLADPDPTSNWTFPAPHEYNFPGWLHFWFFIGACSLFTVLWTEFFYRLRGTYSAHPSEGRKQLESGAFALALGTAGAFTWMVSVDSVGADATQASTASIIGLAVACLAIFWGLFRAAGPALRFAVITVLTAVLVAVALIGLATHLPPDAVIVAMVVSAAAFGMAFGMTGSIGNDGQRKVFTKAKAAPELEWVAVPALYVWIPLQASFTRSASTDEVFRVAVWFVGLVLLSLAFRWLRRGELSIQGDGRWLFVVSVFLIVTNGALTFWRMGALDAAGVSASLAFAALAGILAGPAIRLSDKDLAAIIKIEKTTEFRASMKPTSEQMPVVARLYLRLAVCLVAAGASIWGLMLLTGYAVGWNKGGTGLTMTTGELIAFGLALATSIFLALRAAICGSKRDPAVTIVGRTASSLLVCLTALSLAAGLWMSGAQIEVWAGLQSLVIALFAGECVSGNGLRIGLVRPLTASKAIIFSSTLGVWAAAYWSLTKGIGTTSEPVLVWVSFLALLGSLLLVAALVFGATTSIYGAVGSSNRSYEARAGGAVQDFALLAVMWGLMGWMPRLIYAHIPDQEVTPYKWVTVGMVFVGFLALYVAALLWLIKANDGHVGRRMRGMKLWVPPYAREGATHWARFVSIKRRLSEYLRNDGSNKRELREARALSGHTAAQNILSLTLVALTIAGALWLTMTDWEVEETTHTRFPPK